ncbi:hypothetical protein vBSlqSZDD2_58 [Serratia phage vB_SlqS_ZDD2]|nr:hypothetical protein vBSlqSZDD2_58 [Serratia phage vB_SlqS_ZDD2]
MAEVNIHNIDEGYGREKVYTEFPPGFVGEIMKDIAKKEIRPQPTLRIYGAIHLVAAAANHKVKTPGHMKLNLITMVVGASASGKDAAIDYAQKVAGKLGMAKYFYGSIASEQDISNNFLDSSGVSVYVVDEAHDLFKAINDKRSPAYLQKISGALMKSYTSSLYTFRGNDKRQAQAEYDDAKKKIEKVMNDEGVKAPAEFEKRMAHIKERLMMVQDGLRDPFLSLYAISTPDKMAEQFSIDNIESGFLGRALIGLGTSDRPAKVPRHLRDFTDPAQSIVNRLQGVVAMTTKIAKWKDDETAQLAMEIEDRIDDARNDPILGAIAARSWEQVEKLATVLSIPDGGVISKEMLLWSFFFACDSMRNLSKMLNVNLAAAAGGTEGRWKEFIARIYSVIGDKFDEESGIPQGQLTQRVFKSVKMRKLAESYASRAAMSLKEAQTALMTCAIMELNKAKAIQFVRQKYWTIDAGNFDKAEMPAKFVQMVEADNLARYASMR